MADVCDLAYVMLLEQVDRRVAVETQVAAFTVAMGGKMEIPDPLAARADLDQALEAEPVPVKEISAEQKMLREALGLSRG